SYLDSTIDSLRADLEPRKTDPMGSRNTALAPSRTSWRLRRSADGDFLVPGKAASAGMGNHSSPVGPMFVARHVMQAEYNLFYVVLACQQKSALTGGLHCPQQKPEEHGYDADNHQSLQERQSTTHVEFAPN